MKKLFCIMLSVVFLLCVTGCKVKNDDIINAVFQDYLQGYDGKSIEKAINDYFNENDVGLGEISVSQSDDKSVYSMRIPAEISYQSPLKIVLNSGDEVEILSLSFIFFYNVKSEKIVDAEISGMIAANSEGITGSIIDGRNDSKRDFSLNGFEECVILFDVIYGI